MHLWLAFVYPFVETVNLKLTEVASCDGECQADRSQGRDRGRMSRDRVSRDRMSRDRMSRGGSTIPTAFSCPGFKFLFQFHLTNFLCVIRLIERFHTVFQN